MTYPGGKEGAGVWQRIVNLMPPHDVYVELFAGGGAVLRNKEPAPHEYAFDLDPDALIRLKQWAREAARGATILNQDALSWLEEFVNDTELEPPAASWLFYADPPYPLSVRRTDRVRYYNELTDADHVALLGLLKKAGQRGVRVMLSGYRCALYDVPLADWYRVDYEAMTRGGVLVPESLWMNFPPPLELRHGYDVVGNNFRERERIKRKRRRWLANFSRLENTEREAIFSDLSNYQAQRRNHERKPERRNANAEAAPKAKK